MPFLGFSQLTGVNGTTLNQTATWETNDLKAQGDSCGAYFNNYIALGKLSLIREEPMRIGDLSAWGQYNGRAQRFEAPQEIEVSGIEFFAYIKNNPTLDTIMVITSLNEYDVLLDSVSTELIRDTAYVTNHSFSNYIPNMSVKSYFDTPVTVNTDYVVSVFTPTNDSLYIIATDLSSNSGNGENLSHLLYDNDSYPSYYGWYSAFNGDLAGLSYDYDFLIAPLVEYKLQDGFVLDNDTICPGVISNACLDYTQQLVFNNQQYNSSSATNTSTVHLFWGDDTFNSGLTSACHMYQNSGTYDLNLRDTIYTWDYDVVYCTVDLHETVLALDTVVADFTFINSNLTADFTNTTTFSDSIAWNFGDGTLEGNNNTPTHTYTTINTTYDVWLYAYNQCTTDSIMYQITTDNVGITSFENLISIYPNPTNNKINITNLPNNVNISIYNILGEIVKSIHIESNATEINVQDLVEGSYILKIENNQETIVKKIVIQH
jgi:hypothetical protein